MTVEDHERFDHPYPSQRFDVREFTGALSTVFSQPPGLVTAEWPPVQVKYLNEYLARLGCQTMVVENHYIDRDFMGDVALFYSRSLRGYPNSCRRLHFFASGFGKKEWRSFVGSTGRVRARVARELHDAYLGFSVVRPLPGSPVGRTVVPTLGEKSSSEDSRLFGAVRDYAVHVAGFTFNVRGLAFQQQDQGVSACATTALWSALHSVANREGIAIPTPAEITEAASRYLLMSGRSLPSEGLSTNQLCEATRAAGLSPLHIRSDSLEHDRGQLLGYLSSGLPVVLVIQPIGGGDAHAVCAVGVKLGPVSPQTNPDFYHRDGASAVKGVYIHDDRLGPYATADLYSHTDAETTSIRTAIRIRWPGEPVEFQHCIVKVLVVPVPVKLRLTIARIRFVGAAIATMTGKALPEFERTITLNCRFLRATEYLEKAHTLGLSRKGLYQLVCGTVFSRYIGVIELTVPDGPLFDVLLDATETESNPSVLCCVRRAELPNAAEPLLVDWARVLGGSSIS